MYAWKNIENFLKQFILYKTIIIYFNYLDIEIREQDEKCSMVRLKKYCKEISRQCGVFGNVLWLGNGQPTGRTSKP